MRPKSPARSAGANRSVIRNTSVSNAFTSRAELGNLRYDLWQDQSDPNRFVLDELYADADAVAAHRETPHFQNYLSQIGDLAERGAFVLNPVSAT